MQYRIERASSGDIESAKALLEDFVLTVKAHTRKDGSPHVLATGTDVSLPWQYAQYLAQCFDQILNGVEASKALGIAPGEPGRPKLSKRKTNDRDIAIVLAVRKRRRERPGQNLSEHFTGVKRKLKVESIRQVRSAWERADMQLNADLLEQMALEPDHPS